MQHKAVEELIRDQPEEVRQVIGAGIAFVSALVSFFTAWAVSRGIEALARSRTGAGKQGQEPGQPGSPSGEPPRFAG